MSEPVALLATGSAALDEIAAIIGQAASFKLWEEFIGESVSLPIDPADEPRLAKAVGSEIAANLCEELGGRTLQFPVHPISADVLAGEDGEVEGDPVPARSGPRKKAIFGKVVALIGEEGAYKLACEFRSERFRIPVDHTEEPRLSHAIGPDDAARVCHALHGRKVYLGKNPVRPTPIQSPSKTGTKSAAIDEIAELIGEDPALALAFRFRGQNLYVPKDPSLEPGIAETIGDDLAAKFCDAYYSTVIYMPMREAIRRIVCDLASKGVTKMDIARQLHIAQRQVYRLLALSRDEQA